MNVKNLTGGIKSTPASSCQLYPPIVSTMNLANVVRSLFIIDANRLCYVSKISPISVGKLEDKKGC